MSEHKSRRKFTPFFALIEDEQKVFIDDDGRGRYPEAAAILPRGRHISPALRDGIAFWMAHYPQFLTWLANRGK